DYEAYAQQVMAILGEDFFREQVRALWYESNRGCWWADKSKCTFCGIAEGGFRHKPMDRVLEDLRWLQGRFPDKYVFFTDLIINEGFAGKLLAALPDTEALPPLGMQLKVFRELHEVAELRAIQARVILPGIESFSTRLLKRMRKGTTGKQNLYFLRNAQSMGIQTQYALIWGFPGDTREEYDYLRWLIPKISHIRPPREFEAAQLLRDAPMYQEAGALGITNLAYWKVYDMVYPEWADKASLANYFVGDFPSEIYQAPELLQELEALVVQWRNHHRQSCLHMQSIGNGQYLIEDRRMVHGYEMRHHLVQEPRAQHIMTPTRMAACTEDHAWALEQALGVVLDDWYVPLVLAQSDLLLMLDQSATEVPIQQETAFDTMNS
ncbi:MAG TPA: hypothetical protein DCR93_34420, partial [Cytophagales bacterium]|nr:hypothetical protein [Cytophagales bacterium]